VRDGTASCELCEKRGDFADFHEMLGREIVSLCSAVFAGLREKLMVLKRDLSKSRRPYRDRFRICFRRFGQRPFQSDPPRASKAMSTIREKR
jgi:hypothetical protein